jgi:DNA ligase (NAD+)
MSFLAITDLDKLEEVIVHLDSLYEVGDLCTHPDTGIVVTDGEYDAMRRELQALRPNSKIFSTPTASTVVAVKKVTHNPPMTSISKASHEDRTVQEGQLFKWMNDCITSFVRAYPQCHDLAAKTIDGVNYTERSYNGRIVSYPPGFFYQTYKLDGVACALYYEKGKLVAAGLRPRNGVDGEDITEQVKYVSGIPQTLKLPVTCSIRGELICKLSDFEEVQKELAAAGEKIRANPRNHTAGGIRQYKDPTKVKAMRLSFIGHSVEGNDDPKYTTEVARAKWCNKDLGIPFVQVREFNFYDLDKMEKSISALDYEVDGVIIGVSILDDQEQLGRHGDSKTGNPKGKIAWKFAEEHAGPITKDIEWKTGRTGAVKPVSIFDPVSLAGTQVSRATLHNIGFMFRNQIGIGTQIDVLKAGKIIPKVVGVKDFKKNYSSVEYIEHPHHCPSCNSTLVIESVNLGKASEAHELMCKNVQCAAQNINGLCHYLATFGVLGLGESKVTSLVEGGVVKIFSDFYKLDVPQAMSCGLSERQSLLAIAGIHMIGTPDKYDDDGLKKKIASVKKNKKVIPLWRLFASFGIEAAGKSAGKALVDYFGDFDKIRKATADELAVVKDVGDKTAGIISTYMQSHVNEIDELLNYIEPELPKVGPLTGQSFVLTGGFTEGKSYWEKEIENQGGKCSSSVSKTTSYVVIGVDAGSKEQKADALGIKKLNVVELKTMLGV